MTRPIAVLGAGGWGTALAVHLARAGHPVRLWGRDESLVAEIRRLGVNRTYLPDTVLPEGLQVTSQLDEVFEGAELVVSAVPSHGTRDVLNRATVYMPSGAIVVSATKGLESGTLFRMSEVVEQELGAGYAVAVLSGPSFAAEVVQGLPTAVCVASASAAAVAQVQADFRAPYFRVYGSDDVVGVEVGGALKNEIAIAAGAAEGLGLGHNAVAGLITRGLAEVTRLACSMGAERDTLSGLAGLGDLVLTCTGAMSRNRRVGIELGKGRTLAEVLAGMKMVAEGVKTADAALALGARHDIELPISAQVANVLAGRKDPRGALYDLMLRPQRTEAG